MSYLLINRNKVKLQTDGFTYGEWRQYVAFLPDKTAVCCRYALLPTYLMVIGVVLLSLPLMAAYLAWNGVSVDWPRTIGIAGIGLALLAPWTIMWLTPWRLLVAVSEPMTADERGVYTRHF